MEKSSTRRPKWKYPQPQQTPRILHLPRRPRRKILPPPPAPPPSAAKPSSRVDRRGRLDNLFDQERDFKAGPLPIATVSGVELERRRERVEERESKSSAAAAAAAAVEEEKWRFQAEMLRAECNLLRMEKEIGLNKMERRKAHMERTLQSALHTLLSGRERICNGENGRVELEEEIGRLVVKLEKLQRRSSSRRTKDLNRECVKEIQEMAEASLSIRPDDGNEVSSQTNFNVVQIEILRRKMEGLSRGRLLERMEDEYGSMLSTANSSAASSASTSRRIDLPPPEKPPASVRQHQQSLKENRKKSCKEEEQQQKQQQKKGCGGNCKAIVRRVMEQVRAETEQWSQMQAMLGQVRDEMEQLQASRQFWEDRALDSDSKLQNLHSTVEEWRQKAISFEDKAKELEREIHGLKKLKSKDRSTRGRNVAALAASPKNETEKRVLVCRMKENRDGGDEQQQFRLKDMLREERRKSMSGAKRSPFRDVGNTTHCR
ncbi:hypothetical protein LINGRAHAP2_LOCUS21609 [Linum grandiflorum]